MHGPRIPPIGTGGVVWPGKPTTTKRRAARALNSYSSFINLLFVLPREAVLPPHVGETGSTRLFLQPLFKREEFPLGSTSAGVAPPTRWQISMKCSWDPALSLSFACPHFLANSLGVMVKSEHNRPRGPVCGPCRTRFSYVQLDRFATLCGERERRNRRLGVRQTLPRE